MEHKTGKSFLSKYGIALFIILYLGAVAVWKTVSAPGVVLEQRPWYKGEGAKTTVALDSSVYGRSKLSVAEAVSERRLHNPGLKPYLGGLAMIDDEGWIYPDGIDNDISGYKYDRTNPHHVILAVIEAFNNSDANLYRELTKKGPAWKDKQVQSYPIIKYKIENQQVDRVLDLGKERISGVGLIPKDSSLGFNIADRYVTRDDQEYENNGGLYLALVENDGLWYVFIDMIML